MIMRWDTRLLPEGVHIHTGVEYGVYGGERLGLGWSRHFLRSRHARCASIFGRGPPQSDMGRGVHRIAHSGAG